jgi:PAS domain S-box-containing protein
VAVVVTYVLFGHAMIKAMYDSDITMVNRIMAGKATTPLEQYFFGIDQFVLRAAVYFSAVAVGLLLFTNPLGLVISTTSFFLASLGMFLLLDVFPEFVKPLHFDAIPYYSYRLTYMPDPVLGFRARPFVVTKFDNYRGGEYSPLFGINVPPQSGVWQTDDEGFRNPAPTLSSAEIAVVGSSFVEWGNDGEDTYPSKLEQKLGGQKVVNLGKAGYGPLQYIEVLKRYALEKKPRYVILTFYPVYDTDDQLRNWMMGREDRILAKYTVGSGRFFRRYSIAVRQTWDMLIDGSWTALQLGFRRITGTEGIHPDLAVLRLPHGVTKKILFSNRHSMRSTEEILRSPEWRVMEAILVDFKQLCEQNQIVPLILYIPAASEVYAEYSTSESGGNWLAVRKSQIASSGNSEEAARRVAQNVGIRMITLLPAFREAARQGKLIYYQLDVHWTAEGREIAAQVTADALKALGSELPQGPVQSEAKRPEKTKRLHPTLQEAMLDRKDGIMVRSIDGKINFWNSGAQRLYGWSKSEAIGKVSHNLLRTQFPEPLEKIDAELVQKGEWQGKLVHATRDGRRVVVDSRWVLDPKEPGHAVIEINIPFGTS